MVGWYMVCGCWGDEKKRVWMAGATNDEHGGMSVEGDGVGAYRDQLNLEPARLIYLAKLGMARQTSHRGVFLYENLRCDQL